ncbi:holliday junction resolvase RusA-like protein [Sinorhizobium phage PBC5]|uniref:holliday junction resolvase RusA-like protein n=1 Tax=Sinorhizobium phage PBC5 TaxID=179237 RepID=UPI001BE97666|nr:holliday junction resolvase RusA-like protein [Sinorhizobium phage PBC5]
MIAWSDPSYLADWRIATVGTVRVGYVAPPTRAGEPWQWWAWLSQRGFPERGTATCEEQARAAVVSVWHALLAGTGLRIARHDERPWLRVPLPMPPSVWDLYEGWAQTRRLSKTYKKWRTDAGYFIKPPPAPISRPFDIVIAMERPHGLMDVDNRIKPVLDCLQHYKVIKNDNLCESMSIRWQADLGHECIAEVREVAA